MALSNKGTIYTWGQNDKGQLGLGNEISTTDPQPITSINKQAIKIDCGLKHCLALTKDYQLLVWGSNLQSQLGKKLPNSQTFINYPIVNTAYDGAKPFKISCGSYHNICLSYKPPK